jgi:type 1 glutamine amidotransferase
VTTLIDVLVVTGGHPFEAEPFFAVFDALDGIRWQHATTPATGHDVVVFYDMPGLRFTGGGDPPVELVEPTATQRAVIEQLCADGAGLVFLHHAVAGWPAWPAYAELIGGRFAYQPQPLAGVDFPDSGYRFDVTHTVEVLAPEHPVCAGLGDSFTITDELYCFPVLEDRVTPLMRTTFPMDSSGFWSADEAIRGRRNSNDGWTHPRGSDLVAWTRAAGDSTLVYLQFGDGPATYADPAYRRALRNAIHWTAAQAPSAAAASSASASSMPEPPR